MRPFGAVLLCVGGCVQRQRPSSSPAGLSDSTRSMTPPTAAPCAAYRADCAAARQDRASNRTYASTDRGVFVPLRHSAAGTQANCPTRRVLLPRRPVEPFQLKAEAVDRFPV